MAVINDRFIFFHIPKTGGTFVNRFLRRYLPKSAGRVKNVEPDFYDIHDLRKAHVSPEYFSKDVLDSRFKFAFVRHPLDWYKSQYAYRRLIGWDKDYPLYKYKSDDFLEYVNNVLDNYDDGWFTMICKRFLGEDLSKMDFIGRQENLKEDLAHVLRHLDIDFNPTELSSAPLVNVSTIKVANKYHIEYDSATRDRVLEKDRWVVENFYKVLGEKHE